MKFYLLAAWTLWVIPALTTASTFTDDLGVTHTFEGKPKIVTWAQTAVTLRHLGLQVDQLKGTYGERTVDGSDYDFSDPDAGSNFPADPTADELAFLNMVPNLSPGCVSQYCTEFDLDRLRELKPDIVIMHGYRQSVWGLNAMKLEIEAVIGRPIVFIDVSQDGPDCTKGKEKSCFGKSMIEVIAQYEALAQAIGIELSPSVQDDRKRLCQAATNFQNVAEGAHNAGVRAMAAYISPQFDGDFGVQNYFANPVDDLVLRMLEELGMPLMHVDCNLTPDEESCPLSYFWETVSTSKYFGCNETGLNLKSCNSDTLYPVDFWLYDHRVTTSFTDPNFKDYFPDQAVIAEQMAYWPIGAGTVSYRHAAEILELVAGPLAEATRLHPATACSPKIDVSGVSHRIFGLEGGKYACFDRTFHREEYLVCSANTDETDNNSLSTGAIVALIVGIAIGAAVLVTMLFGAFLLKRRQHESEKQADTGAKAELEVEESTQSREVF